MENPVYDFDLTYRYGRVRILETCLYIDICMDIPCIPPFLFTFNQ